MLIARRNSTRAFSLIELVIVVVILGIIGAIAIPRMSRGAAGASESSLRSNLAAMRSAIELYSAEHNGLYPTVAGFSNQMTLYSDVAGNTNATKSSTYAYGPYLRAVPALPVGAKAGKNAVSADGSGANDGWVYNATTGHIYANTTATELAADGTTKFSDF